jgi:hypothetical protein
MENGMSNPRISRRDAGRQLFLMSAAMAVPTWLVAGCGKKELSCTDVTGLTPDEMAARMNTLAYTEKSTDPLKVCSKCQLFKPAAEGCGACTVLKGPINPAGSCKSFAPKVT